MFFLMYLAIPILFARRRAPERYVDGTLVFGTPLVAFGLQTQLVRDIEYGAAWSAVALSLVYLVLARLFYTRHREELRMLVEAFLALGVVFGTLAIPLALDGRWTSAAWALEGAAILWAGRAPGPLARARIRPVSATRRGHRVPDARPRQPAATCRCSTASTWDACSSASRASSPTGTSNAIASALPPWERWAVPGGVRVGAGVVDLRRPAGDRRRHATAAATHVFAAVLRRLRGGLQPAVEAHRWRLARYPALGLLPVMIVVALAAAVSNRHPLAASAGWPGRSRSRPPVAAAPA